MYKYCFLLVFILIIFSFKKGTEYTLNYPKSWPKPVYDFKKNPLDSSIVKLGKMLFNDPILSRDGSISCSSCHLQQTGFTHIDHDLSHGIDGKIGNRNSLALINLAWMKSFMWDGAIHHIDVQALAPIENPNEMDNSIKNVVSTLQKSPRYRNKFAEVYGDSIISGSRVLKTIAQYCLSLVSCNSKYDKVIAQHSDVKFTEQEQKGYEIFKSKCNNCHTEPLFTNNTFQRNGIEIDPTLNDIGRMKVTQLKKDSMLFKVPTLRNIAITSPYMHDGRFQNLQMVLFHYSTNNKMNIELGEQDKKALIAFLKTLTDEEFLRDKTYSYLGSE